MNTYMTRRGNRKASTACENIYDIDYEEVEDDGLIVVAGGNLPVCPDCGQGHLQWAEAGYVPWHRICDVCGSHWSLHPVRYMQWGVGRAWTGTSEDGFEVAVERMDPDPRLPDGVTHVELLRLAIEHGTEANGSHEDQRIAGACWAERARFY